MLDGPRLEPKSGTTKQLVVFLHGYGADGNDLIDIGRQWAAALPDAVFVSPHAPEACGMNPMGRQWFGLTFRDPNERWTGVNAAHPDLNAFLDAELLRHGLDDAQMALVGFSQGTMMALHTGLRRKKAPGCILGFSGMMAGVEHLEAQATVKPPVLLIHGDQDEVIPVQALYQAGKALSEAGFEVEGHISKGLGHGIDGDGLRLGAAFLARSLT